MDRSPSATPSVLFSMSAKGVNAPALAGDDGVGRLVEQHEERLDRRRVRLVAEADQFVEVDQRELASAAGDARDRSRGAADHFGRDGEPLGGEQAAARGEHEGRHAGVERMFERQLYGDLRPAWACRLARSGRHWREAQEGGHENCGESCEHGPMAAQRDRLETTHRFTPDWCARQNNLPHRSCQFGDAPVAIRGARRSHILTHQT